MYLQKTGHSKMSRRVSRTIKTVASIASLSTALGLTACTRDYTLAYLYVTTTSSAPGVINQYAVDYQSGALVQIGTPVNAGTTPVASVAAPNAKFVYVVNQGDSTVQEFAVGSDGLLTSKNTYPTTGNTPTAIAIDTLGKFLFVTCKYQGTNTTGAGAVSVFPINSDNSLGTATNYGIGNNPVGVAIANFNPTVYIVDQDPTTPQVLAFAEDTTTGALTPVPGSAVPGATSANGFSAGVQPSAIAEDPTGRFVYVTDKAANQLIGYTVLTGGKLLPMVNGPFATGLYPVAIIVDPRGEYIYVTNYNSKTIGAYALNVSNGTPSGVAGSSVTTDTGPVALALDPALGIYLYTANFQESSVSGERLNPSTGVLTGIQNTPFPSNASPTSVTIVANGSHPTELLQP
jgi:6-phosphogluconolactonase (cycloisomerase 2 family)